MPDKDKLRLEPYPTTSALDDTDVMWVQNSDGTDAKITGASLKSVMAGVAEVVDDTTPQLGGDLDLNGKNIDFPTTANISDCLDEDDMASDSATALATQQSIKAYVDTYATMLADTDVSSASYVVDEDDMASDLDTKVPTQQSVKAYVDTYATMLADTDVSSAGYVVDEDDMASDLDTKVPTQQSVKAYADTYFLDIATFDPTGVGGDAFDMDNMVDGSTNVALTAVKDAYIDQDVTSGSSPSFTSATLTTPSMTAPTIDSVLYGEATGTIASADVLQLNATPIQLIAAPGANKAIVIDEIQWFLDYGSATYVAGAGEDLTVQYSSGTDIAVIDNDAVTFLTAGADEHWIGRNFAIYDASVAGTGDGVLLSSFDNEAVYATIASGEVATGDSDLKYRISYHVVDYLT